MKKKKSTPIAKALLRTYLINGESHLVDIHFSPLRRTLALHLGKRGFICNTPSFLPDESRDAFIEKSIPKLLKKTIEKPIPAVGDDVYLFGVQEHIEGFSAWNKPKRNAYLRKLLLPYVEEKTTEHTHTMKVEPPYAVKVREAHTVYGVNHRNQGFITYALSLVHYDPHTIDSVVCHELAHHFALGHGKRFYKILLNECPDYWASRKKLIRHIYD